MRLRYVALFFLGCFCVINSFAQEFTRINWGELRIDTLLPRYTHVYELDDDYAQYNYSVRLEYPEFASLTKSEVEALTLLVDSLPEMPSVDTFVGVSRRKGQLDVQFVPIVQREGRYLKLTSCKIVVEKSLKIQFLSRMARVASNSSRYAKQSVLSSGKWVKIRVTDEGVYQLTNSALSRMGFSTPSRVKLYGYGGRMQNEVIDTDADFDDLEEVPLYSGANGLLFYAHGVVSWSDVSSSNVSTHTTNPYSRYSYYFLTEGDSPLSFPTDETYSGVPSKTYTTFPDHVLYEDDSYAWYHSGRKLFDGTAFSGSRNFNMSLPGIVTTEKATVTVATTASESTSTAFSVYANNTLLGTGSISSNVTYSTASLSTRNYSTTGVLTESSVLRIQQATGRLDYIRINYIRSLSMTSTYLSFTQYGTGSACFQLANANAQTQVWRIGTKGNPTARVQGTLSGSTYSVNVPTANARYVAVNTSGSFPSPTFVENIGNQNLHAIDSIVDMVILVPKSGHLTAQAERLANAHRAQDGLRVVVVRADEVYNEFSSGTPDATAYRRFMKMLYDNAATVNEAPRYLLLFGDCAWDNRMLSSLWKSYSPDDFLLSFQSEESFSQTKSYIMEDYFGLLDDGEGADLVRDKVDLGIGRFPVRTASEAKIMVDKVLSYMSGDHTGAWRNTICMLGDDGDNNQHMNDAQRVSVRIASKFPDFRQELVYWDSYVRETTSTGHRFPAVNEKIHQIMKSGALMMNYSGHGAPYVLSHEQVLRTNDFKEFSSPRLPLWFTAACDVMPFDGQEDNIGEAAVLNEKGAAIAFVGTTRTVYATQNNYINRFFCDYVFDSDEDGNRYRIGDALRLAKCALVATGTSMPDRTENKLHYALLGDPALTLGMPTYKVKLDSINGVAIGGDAPQKLSAGSVARISGHIVNEHGVTVPGFSGTMTATVYDTEETITCFNSAGATSAFTYNDRTKVLFSGSDSVRAGQFTLSFPVPMDINYADESGLISLYAVNNEKSAEAQGSCSDFLIGGTADDITSDESGPKIFVYLNTPDFMDGGTVNGTPYFVAELEDEDGINTTGNGIGHDIQLIIDGDAAMSYVLNDYFSYDFGSYTRGTVSYSLPQLSEGEHRLLFRAWDVRNNSSTAQLNFVVDYSQRPQLFDVTTTENPAKHSTTFIISYDRPAAETTFSLELFDFSGRKLMEKVETGSSLNGYYNIPWDLTNNGGFRVPPGVYLYRVGVSSEGSKRTTKTKKIVVLGNN